MLHFNHKNKHSTLWTWASVCIASKLGNDQILSYQINGMGILIHFITHSYKDDSNGVSMWPKLIRWLIFTVALSLLPLIIDYISKISGGQGHSVNEVISHGELALVCVALSGVGLGEIIGLSSNGATIKISLAGMCFISAVFAIALYIAMKTTTGEIGSLFLDNLSWWVFGSSFITSTASVVVSELME